METSYQTGVLIPNSTQIPDLMLDRWMAELSGAEFKVAMYVARRTYGFRRASDEISLAQMATGIVSRKDGRRLDSGTGLNKDTVSKAVATLIDKGILLRTRHTDDCGRDLPSTYFINLSCQFVREAENIPTAVGKSDPTPDDPPKPDTGVSENPTPPTGKSDSYGSENPTGEGVENPTHNIQWDKQLDIQITTTKGLPDTKASVAVFSSENEDSDSTLHLVAEIVGSTRTAKSIMTEAGNDLARKTAVWWPGSSASKSAKDPGAVFRTACREGYADLPALKSAPAPSKPVTRIIKAPQPEVDRSLSGLLPSARFAALKNKQNHPLADERRESVQAINRRQVNLDFN